MYYFLFIVIITLFTPIAAYSSNLSITFDNDTNVAHKGAAQHLIKNVEASLKDESLIQLAHSNPLYDNIGMLYYHYASNKTPSESDRQYRASVVYIGNGLCLTAAHNPWNTPHHFFKYGYYDYSVCFEIEGKKTPYYQVIDVIIYPDYADNHFYDIAVLILNKPVDGLIGLNPNYDFSKTVFFSDYQHLLTYVGYGMKLLYNDMFCLSDHKRRAKQAHTQACCMKPELLGIYSTPYGSSNDLKSERKLIPYEAKDRPEMSGGAVIHPEYGLVAIISVHTNLKCKNEFSLYLCCLELINLVVLTPINTFV